MRYGKNNEPVYDSGYMASVVSINRSMERNAEMRGPGAHVIKSWRKIKDRSDYHYELYTDYMLEKMRNLAEADCLAFDGHDSVTSGLDAINKVLEKRGAG